MPEPDPSRTHLVLWLRASRNRAKDVASLEVATLLADLDGRPEIGGPLSEQKGVTWASAATTNPKQIAGLLRPLGYSSRVDALTPLLDDDTEQETLRWRRKPFATTTIYAEADAALREMSPDRREFLFEQGDGEVKLVRGYRGGPGDLEHRALPFVDARVLVNLVGRSTGGCLLDPFAGAGGVALAAAQARWSTATADIAPSLRHGLAELADRHVVADARALPFEDSAFDAIATEPPYHESAWEAVAASMHEMRRVLRAGAKASLLVAQAQRDMLRDAADDSSLAWRFEAPVLRKGTNTTIVVLEKLRD